MALVGAHAWDIPGAKRAGLLAGWVARQEPTPSAVMDMADARGPSPDEAGGLRPSETHRTRPGQTALSCVGAHPLVAATVCALLWLEHLSPLSRSVLPQAQRLARTSRSAPGRAAGGGRGIWKGPLVARVAHRPHGARMGRRAAARVGVAWAAGNSLASSLSCLAEPLSCTPGTFWLHRAPLLWKAAPVHHADRDLDLSVLPRHAFTPRSWVMLVPARLAQMSLIGGLPRTQRFALSASLTARSGDVPPAQPRLPGGLESVGGAGNYVTPRMHGIHHSTRREERDSNFSSGLALAMRCTAPVGTACRRTRSRSGLAITAKKRRSRYRPACANRFNARLPNSRGRAMAGRA